MVFTNAGKTAIRNWLAGSSSQYPSYIFVGTTSETISEDTTTFTASKALTPTVDTSIIKQVTWEGFLATTELTTSTLRKVGLGTETTGTAGTLYIIEEISPITKTDSFDLQIYLSAEVE